MFRYENKTNKYLNKEIDQRLGKLTNQGLIRSEEEYKKTVEGILEKVRSDLGRMTNPQLYQAKPDNVIKSRTLNNMFKDLESDVRILFNELRDAHKVLDMTLSRNKTFFRRIKDKISSMWKEIGYFRETSFNTESADYTFFESFDSEKSSMMLNGIEIDKKVGKAHLQPAYQKIFNFTNDIQEVKTTLFPVENKDGGVYNTSHSANDIVLNYNSGNRDMMSSGLWKIQLLTASVPEIILDPLNLSEKKTYNGVMIYLDIYFTGSKLINELGFDPYGEFFTDIIGIRYKKNLDGEWNNAIVRDNEDEKIIATANGKDWIYIRNMDPFHAKVMRIIVYQENYSTISKLLSKMDTMVDKITKDLIEGRYEKSYYKYKFMDQFPRVSDTSKDRGTLYDEVINAIEEEKDVETLENKITQLLIPQPIEIDQDIQNWKVYNIGAWSIEPKMVRYPSEAVGIYYSHDIRVKDSGFKFDSGAPTEATLYTKQEEPPGTLIEWSLLVNDKEIPIIPNDDMYRTEAVSIGEYYPLKNYSLRNNTGKIDIPNVPMRNLNKMIKIDFPVHPAYIGEIIVYENGKELVNGDSSIIESRGYIIEMYNSTELYIPGIDFIPGYTYAVKYLPAVIDTVECWTLNTENEPIKGKIDLASAMVFTNKDTAQEFSKTIKGISLTKAPKWITKSENYRICRHLCTKQEYDDWFLGGRVPMFIDDLIDNDNKPGIDWLPYIPKKNYNSDMTKLTWLYDSDFDIKPYSNDGIDFSTWQSLTSAPPLMVNKAKYYQSRNK